MPNWQDQLSDDTDSSYSDTTFLSKDSDAIDLTFSDYESGYVPSETSVDRAFVASETVPAGDAVMSKKWQPPALAKLYEPMSWKGFRV